ncbi:zinc finger protein 148-like isoform X2 [Diorhabda carinulata]|uniref:zinc finger protein 148-like isoform X2 n=1 Tax=Diorhabda carinulata TaxID=1163345 RepID=UPI0025A01EEE|nr:zinc finger protein 148-like isoform X2 [Diorhabda carinulata]
MDNNNMLKLCRLCLVKDDVNIPIFEEQGDIRQIFLKISSCLPVKVSRDDQLPKKICDGCSYKLDMLYEFWNTSANAEKQLLTWLGEAGMSSQMADGTISAVAQQIKPADAFVKQETIDPPDIHMDDDDDDDEEDKDYMKQEDNSNNVEEPPPKRARRTAAVKAAIALDQNSDDDDDSGEPMTKVEDDSEDSDNEDHEPAFVDVPSTSADDQPGPSGVGKDGVEAPSIEVGNFKIRSFSIYLTNIDGKKPIAKEKQSIFVPNQKSELNHEEPLLDRKKIHTCYVCMQKFATLDVLLEHKREHSESEGEDDLFEEDTSSQDNKICTDENNAKQKVKNSDELEKNPELPQQSKGKKRKLKKGSNVTTTTIKTQKDDTKENKVKPKALNADTISLEKNTTTQNNVKTPFKCDTCNIFFATSDEAKTHIPPSAAKCKFSCHLCNRKFNTLYALIVHIMQHKNDAFKNQNSSKSLYNCKLCDKNFADCFQLKRHEIKVHKKEAHIEPAYTEPTEIITTHVVIREHDTETQLTCDLCYDVFNTKEELDSHTEFHKQLDSITQPLSYETNKAVDGSLKISEDKQGLIKTIQKPRNSPSQKKNIPSETFTSLPSTSSTQNKKNLTATIKEMIAPNEIKPKQSKTIFLPNIEEEKLEEKRRKISSKIKVVYQNNEVKRKKRLLPKLDFTKPINKAGTNFQQSKVATPLNPLTVGFPVISQAKFATSSFVSTSPSTSNIPYIFSTSNSYATNPPISPFTHILLSNSSSVSPSILVPPTSTSITPSTTIDTVSASVLNIPETSMHLPKIERVMSLAQSIESYDKIITTSEASKLNQKLNEIIILDSDSSDEEKNLIIDETLLKIEPNEKIGETDEVEPEPDDIDDHFEEDECHTIAEKSKSNEDFPKTCSNCQSIFYDQDSFNSHENNKINCKRCDHQFCKVTDLKTHYISVHRELFCSKCHFTTEVIVEFAKHESNECKSLEENNESAGNK